MLVHHRIPNLAEVTRSITTVVEICFIPGVVAVVVGRGVVGGSKRKKDKSIHALFVCIINAMETNK